MRLAARGAPEDQTDQGGQRDEQAHADFLYGTELWIAGRNNGFSEAETRDVTLASARAYRESMARFAKMGTILAGASGADEPLNYGVPAGGFDSCTNAHHRRLWVRPVCWQLLVPIVFR